MAAVYGLRGNVRAVLVDVWKLVRDCSAPTVVETARVDCAAIHEAAHAITTAEVSPETVSGLLDTAGHDVPRYTPDRVARQHHARWAVAMWLLATRAAVYRPQTGAAMVELAAHELAVYGFPRADLEAVATGVPADEPLAARLQAGGAWDALLGVRLPDEETRAAAIVAAGVPCVATTNGA
jgi:hypothetical protein